MLEAKKLLDSFNIDKSKPVIIAVSGGIDSMALLFFLIEEKYNPIVVHFNHNTRESNIKDEGLIKAFCGKYKIPVEIFNIRIKKGNFQSEARNERYRLLRKVAKKNNTPYIATAHHLDDLAETVLIKITRGSNLYGYSGINPIYTKSKFVFIKPLLFTSKTEITKYQKFNEIPYLDDESNFTNSYLRNRYRHSVIPILKQENTQFLSKIETYHHQLSDAYSYINKVANTYIKSNIVDLNSYKDLDVAIQNEIINILLTNKKLDSSYETITKIRLMLLNDKPNNTYDLKHKYQFIKSYNKFYLIKVLPNLDFNLKLNEDINIIPSIGNLIFLKNEPNLPQNYVELWYNSLSLPLIARRRKPGDVLQFTYGKKKLKDYLMELKIPPHKRDELWLITDSENTILWVSDIYINKSLGSNKSLKFTLGGQ